MKPRPPFHNNVRLISSTACFLNMLVNEPQLDKCHEVGFGNMIMTTK